MPCVFFTASVAYVGNMAEDTVPSFQPGIGYLCRARGFLHECAMAETSNQRISNAALWCFDSFRVLLLGYCHNFHVVALKPQINPLRTHACSSPVEIGLNYSTILQSLSKISPQITSSCSSQLRARTLLGHLCPKFYLDCCLACPGAWRSSPRQAFWPVKLSKKLSAIWMLKVGYQHATLLKL
jgi:hypothetical protein